MLLLDGSSPSALGVDVKLPPSARRASEALAAEWPQLAGRVELREQSLADVALEPGDVIVSCHACGPLTDAVLERALSVRARVAVLPCCQSAASSDAGGLGGWLDPALAVDVTRVARLRAAGYRVHTQTIPAEITPKNRLLLGAP
jgi:hypothetical protein